MSRRKSQRGLTILEALVAVLILSIGATAVMSAFAAGARQSSARAARFQAIEAAQDRLALLRAEAIGGAAPIAREASVNGFLFRERSRQAGAADQDPVDSALIEISVEIVSAADPARNVLSLIDYVVVARP